jgi:hypothetical protein
LFSFETLYIKILNDHNWFNSSLNDQRQTSIFLPRLLGSSMIVYKNMSVTNQQEYGAANDPNGLNPSVYNITCMFCGFIEN